MFSKSDCYKGPLHTFILKSSDSHQPSPSCEVDVLSIVVYVLTFVTLASKMPMLNPRSLLQNLGHATCTTLPTL